MAENNLTQLKEFINILSDEKKEWFASPKELAKSLIELFEVYKSNPNSNEIVDNPLVNRS